MITASNRLSSSTARGVFSPRCCGRASARAGVRSAPSCAVSFGAIRANWPQVEILLRADSHYTAPEVLEWCRANRVDWVLGLASNAALRRHVEALEKTTAERFRAAPARGKVRRFKEFYDGAQSWSRVERIIARVEAGPVGIDTRFIVTNLEGGRPKQLYQALYCARGQAAKRATLCILPLRDWAARGSYPLGSACRTWVGDR